MSESFLISGRDMVFYAIPFVLLTFACLFKLDGVATSSKQSANRRGSRCGASLNGEPVLRDPDGRLSEKCERRK
jgi:hypothetical protein